MLPLRMALLVACVRLLRQLPPGRLDAATPLDPLPPNLQLCEFSALLVQGVCVACTRLGGICQLELRGLQLLGRRSQWWQRRVG